jgi:hypothetical protein
MREDGAGTTCQYRRHPPALPREPGAAQGEDAAVQVVKSPAAHPIPHSR